MKKTMYLLSAVLILALANKGYSHCEIPCGIYNDQLRSDLIAEHITTIEKSMQQIVKLSAKSPVDYNQLVRWVDNKEAHANELQHIVTQYFMTQRIKLVEGTGNKGKYNEQVGLLHELLVHSMKAKQSTDQGVIKKLRQSLDAFNASYFGKDYKRHTH